MMRTFGDERIASSPQHCEVPVINGLTDGGHPVQILTDLFTIEERLGRLKGKTIAFVGRHRQQHGPQLHRGCQPVRLHLEARLARRATTRPTTWCACRRIRCSCCLTRGRR